MTGLTLFTPVRPQWLLFCGWASSCHGTRRSSARHILQFNFIKFVRWTVVREPAG